MRSWSCCVVSSFGHGPSQNEERGALHVPPTQWRGAPASSVFAAGRSMSSTSNVAPGVASGIASGVAPASGAVDVGAFASTSGSRCAVATLFDVDCTQAIAPSAHAANEANDKRITFVRLSPWSPPVARFALG